jgi:hypothetical protein
MTTNRSGSRVTIHTVDDVLASTAIGNGFHDWAVEGGTIRITEAELRPALEAAYDPNMPDWPVFVDLDT